MGVVEEINDIIDLEIIINYDVTAVKLYVTLSYVTPCYTCNSLHLLHSCNSI